MESSFDAYEVTLNAMGKTKQHPTQTKRIWVQQWA